MLNGSNYFLLIWITPFAGNLIKVSFSFFLSEYNYVWVVGPFLCLSCLLGAQIAASWDDVRRSVCLIWSSLTFVILFLFQPLFCSPVKQQLFLPMSDVLCSCYTWHAGCHNAIALSVLEMKKENMILATSPLLPRTCSEQRVGRGCKEGSGLTCSQPYLPGPTHSVILRCEDTGSCSPGHQSCRIPHW